MLDVDVDGARHGRDEAFEALHGGVHSTSRSAIGELRRRHRSTESLQFLRTIEANVPPSLNVHLMMDNYSTHKIKSLKAWLARHPGFHAHFTPTSASWLNRVECWVASLTRRYLHRNTYRSTTQLEQAVREFRPVRPSAHPSRLARVTHVFRARAQHGTSMSLLHSMGNPAGCSPNSMNEYGTSPRQTQSPLNDNQSTKQVGILTRLRFVPLNRIQQLTPR